MARRIMLLRSFLLPRSIGCNPPCEKRWQLDEKSYALRPLYNHIGLALYLTPTPQQVLGTISDTERSEFEIMAAAHNVDVRWIDTEED